MLTRYLLLLGAIGAALGVMVFVLPRLLIGRPSVDSIGEYGDWQPSPDAIRVAVGPGDSGVFTDDRHVRFARMFQQRFRNNQKAVGISFERPDRIRAKFAATIPRWDMASVALQARREAGQVFGGHQSVDIYETYISMAAVKIGELRDRPDGQGVTVRFDTRQPEYRTTTSPPGNRFLGMVALSPAVMPFNLPNPAAWLREAALGPAVSSPRAGAATLVPAVMVAPR